MQYEGPEFLAWAVTQPEILPRTYRLHRRFLQTLQHGHETGEQLGHGGQWIQFHSPLEEVARLSGPACVGKHIGQKE